MTTRASRLQWFSYPLLGAYWLALAVSTHTPIQGLDFPQTPHSDKMMHFVAFAGLAFLLAWSLQRHIRSPLLHALCVLLIASGYSVVDEVTQGLVPGRVPDFWDAIADTIGAVIGLFLFLLTNWLYHWFTAQVVSGTALQNKSHD